MAYLCFVGIQKIFLFFLYTSGGYIYLFAIYVVDDVIYMCELNK